MSNWPKIHRQKRAAKKARKLEKLSPRGVISHARRPVVPRPQSLLAPLDLSDDLVAVSVPTWNTSAADLVRAVSSILAGSHRHVRVVVISDGERRPSWEGLPDQLRADPRLVCVRSTKNLGPYFQHDVVLRGARAPFFAVQDSDDESHRERLAKQFAALHAHHAEAVHSPIFQVGPGGARRRLPGTATTGDAWAHHANHFGLYSAPALMALGGYYAGFRVGYDTNITAFLNLLARTRMTRQALYTRHQRGGSLSASRATGHGSALRAEQRRRLHAMWNQAVAKSRESRRSAARWIAAHARQGAAAHGDLGLRDDLVAQIRETFASRPIQKPPLGRSHLDRVLAQFPDNPAAAPDRAFMHELYRHCEDARPKVIIDVGSGWSTMVFGLYAARHGARVISLEHDSKWLGVIRAALTNAGLQSHVEILLAPLRSVRGGNWYGCKLEEHLGDGRPDFIFVDGPPASKHGARGEILNRIGPLVPGLQVWLHDGKRPLEKRVVAAWRKQHRVSEVRLDTSVDDRGVWKLRIA